MASFSKSIKQAADDAERLGAALRSLPQGGSFSGPPSGGSGGSGGVTFVTNVQAPRGLPATERGALASGGSGGGNGGGGGILNTKSQKSDAYLQRLAQMIVRQIDADAIRMRTGAAG